MCKLHNILTLFLLIVMVAASDFCEAASPLNIRWSADSAVYSISTTDLPDASGMDLSITYDTATLKEPQVRSGALLSGATMLSNTLTPGFIRIGIMTGGVIKGTGELVSVTFTKTGKGTAPQPILSPSVFSTDYSQLAVQSTTATPQSVGDGSAPDGAVNNSTTTTVATGGSTSGNTGAVPSAQTQNTTQAGVTVGSVSLSQEPGVKNDQLLQGARNEDHHEEAAYQNVPAISAAVAGGGAAAPQETVPAAVAEPEPRSPAALASLSSSQSVPDRFRAFKGLRSLKQLSPLFDQGSLHTAGIVQAPAIVVADGKTMVTVTVDLPGEVDTPSFSLKGANLKSIKRVSDKKWELVALPQKGKADVRLSILLKGGHADIPLVAVPPVGRTGAELTALSDAALDALLAKPAKNSKPTYDLNSDGRQDYLDDYILVAHWLLKQQQRVNGVGRKPAAVGR